MMKSSRINITFLNIVCFLIAIYYLEIFILGRNNLLGLMNIIVMQKFVRMRYAQLITTLILQDYIIEWE